MGFDTHLDVAHPLLGVWAWFNRPGAVDRLTPGFTALTPVQRADNLANGVTVFDMPGGLQWVAHHDPAHYQRYLQFVDVCVSQPWKSLLRWRHTHTFSDIGDGHTRVGDSVSALVPRRTLAPIFAYRHRQLHDDLHTYTTLCDAAGVEAYAEIGPDHTPLPTYGPVADGIAPNYFSTITVAVTGSHGLVGSQLCAQLETLGFDVIRLVRSTPGPRQRLWDPHRPAADLLHGVDCLIHLAGAPVFGRFTEEHKHQVYTSRVAPTKRLARLVADSPSCHTMVCANAIGYYGATTGRSVTENDGPGSDFLAQTCADWEAATSPAVLAGKRVATIMTGLVLSSRGGLLVPLSRLVRTGAAGQLGDGSQRMSVISLDDLTDIYCQAIVDDTWSGRINGTSPMSVSNHDFMKQLGSILKRPTLIPAPEWAPQLALGTEGAKLTALSDQDIVPQALLDSGFKYRHATLRDILAHELGTARTTQRRG